MSIIIDTVDKIWYIIVKEVLMDNEGTKREGSPTKADIERGRKWGGLPTTPKKILVQLLFFLAL